MITPAKRIYIHPSRSSTLTRSEAFNIDSGMGGSFTVSFQKYENDKAIFRIMHHSPPPDGWDGEIITLKTENLHQVIFLLAPESPYYDNGAQEYAALTKAGYPDDSPEITNIKKRFPPPGWSIKKSGDKWLICGPPDGEPTEDSTSREHAISTAWRFENFSQATQRKSIRNKIS